MQPQPDTPLPSYIRDHRARLRERFLVGGAEALPDYELLELVLFRAIPRRDVKPLARQLMEIFGDFNRVVSAPAARLTAVSGVGEAVVTELKIVEAAAHRLSRAACSSARWSAAGMRCSIIATRRWRIAIPNSSVCCILDRKNVLIADEEQARGTVDHVPVYPREVVKRALELNASALILVHNHPSGDPTPSDADIDMTGQIGRRPRRWDSRCTTIWSSANRASSASGRRVCSERGSRKAQRTQTSTRRLTRRPQSVSSQAIGIASPNASADRLEPSRIGGFRGRQVRPRAPPRPGARAIVKIGLIRALAVRKSDENELPRVVDAVLRWPAPSAARWNATAHPAAPTRSRTGTRSSAAASAPAWHHAPAARPGPALLPRPRSALAKRSPCMFSGTSSGAWSTKPARRITICAGSAAGIGREIRAPARAADGRADRGTSARSAANPRS